MKWKRVRLDSLCSVITKGTTPTSVGAAFTQSGINYIRSEMLTSAKYVCGQFLYISRETHEKLMRSQLREGDILFSMAGAYLGKTVILRAQDVPANTNQAVALIRVDSEKCYNEYVYYYLNIPEVIKTVNTVQSQSAQPNINLKQIGMLEINLPIRPIQEKIVHILAAYDALIDNNQKQIKLLEEAARRLYREWFVNLRFPGHEHVQIVNGVPEGWKKKKVTDILTIRYGKDHKSLNDGKIPAYGSGGIMRKVNIALYSGESILIPRKGSLNNILYVNGDFWTIDTMFYSIPKMSDIAKYMYLFLLSLDMYSFNIGAAVPSMTVNILDGINILVPNQNILKRFEEHLVPIFNKIETLKKQNEITSEARDRLLPKLMSGEIEL